MKKESKIAVLYAPILLTPLMLMSPAATAEAVTHSYNHSAQTSTAFVEHAYTGYCSSTTTFNGTQTFSYDGQPTDSDGDSDQSGSDC
jgi:hypothetical protein